MTKGYRIQILDSGVYLDLSLDRSLDLVKEAAEFNDVNEIKIDGVLSISVPFTPTNHKIFGNYFDINNCGIKADPILCVIWDAHTPIEQRYIYPTKKDYKAKSYEVRIVYEKDHWAYRADNFYIKEINYEPFEYNWDNIIDTWSKMDSDNTVLGYSYPPVFYGRSSQAAFRALDHRAWINEVDMLKRGFCAIGYRLESPLFELPEVKKSSVYLLRKGYAQRNLLDYKFIADLVIIDRDYQYTNSSFQTVYQYPIAFDNITDPQSMIKNTPTSIGYSIGEYVGNPSVVDKIFIKGRVYFVDDDVNSLRIHWQYTVNNEIQYKNTKFDDLDGVRFLDIEDSLDVFNVNGSNVFLTIYSEDSEIERIAVKIYNEPQEFSYISGDTIDLKNEIDPKISLMDALKGFTHSYGGYVDIVNNVITIHPPTYTEVNDVEIEGYYKDESQDIYNTEVDSMVTLATDTKIARYQDYGYKKASDGKIRQEYKDKDPFTAEIDLGDNFRDETKKNDNPLYEPTIVRDTKYYNDNLGLFNHYDSPPTPWLPHCTSDAAGSKINYNVSPRRLIFQTTSQIREGYTPNEYLANVYMRVNDYTVADPNDAAEALYHYPIGYINLNDIPLDFDVIPNANYPAFIEGLDISYLWFYNNFIKNKLQFITSVLSEVSFIGSPETYYSLSFRKSLMFKYNGTTHNAYLLKLQRNTFQDRITATVINRQTLSSLCNDDNGVIDIGGDYTDGCKNRPRLTITKNGNCYDMLIQGSSEDAIEAVTFEYQYQSDDGTYPLLWGIIPNTSTLAAQLCDPTGIFRVRATVRYENCDDIVLYQTVDPCGNNPQLFWQHYTNADGQLCFSVTIGGEVYTPIETQVLTYQINENTPIPYTAGQTVCLDPTGNDFQVCINATLTYEGSCDDSVLNDCKTFPPDEVQCDQTNIVPVCVDAGNGCFTFEGQGNISSQAGAIFYQIKCGEDGDVFIWDGQPVCCGENDLYVRIVVIYCGSVCPTYCSEWVTCDSPCNASVSVSNDCCSVTVTTVNCTNPQIIWQSAPIGSNTWTIISGEVSETLNIATNFQTENRKYRPIVSCDGCSPITGDETEFIQSVSIAADDCAITATLVGIDCPVIYQWQRSTDGGQNWETIEVGEGLISVNADQDALYRVNALYNGCVRTSNVLSLDCNLCDDIVVSIQLQGCCDLVATVTGGVNVSYQWQYLSGSTWIDITNATGSTYTIDGNNTYRVKVTVQNCDDSVFSNTVIVDYGVSVVTFNCSMNANISGGCNDKTVQWQRFDSTTNTWLNIANATNQSYTAVDDGLHRAVVIFGGCVTIESDPVNMDCGEDCDPVVNIAINNNCQLVLLSAQGCDNPVYTLEFNSGSGWQSQGSVTFPHDITANGQYRLNVQCDCGQVYSNTVTASNCCINSITITNDNCILYNLSTLSCIGSCVYQWERSIDGITWTNYSNQAVISVGDNAMYRLRITNGNPCPYLSNVVTTNCASGCNGNVLVQAQGCNFNFISAPCTVATWALQKNINGSWQNISSGSGNPPNTFPIGSNGAYRLSISCTNGCSYISSTLNFTSCGTACNSTLQLSLVNCTIIANVTNCPNAIYSFRRNGITVQTGGSNSYTATEDGTYTVLVTGCAGCGTLQQSISVNGCSPQNSCNCSTSITTSGCNQLLASDNDCVGYSSSWQFSANGSTGWTTVSTGTVSYNASQNGFYRRILSKGGCPQVISNIVQISCISSCSPTLTYQILPDCKIRVDWTGCNGAPSNIQWTYANNNNSDSCAGCSGWSIISSGISSSASSNGTGYSILTPQNGATCYRIIVDCCNGGAPSILCIYYDADPCSEIQTCNQLYWFAALSQNTASNTYINSFKVDGVETVSSPVQVTYSPSVTIAGWNSTYNPSVLNTLNSIAPDTFAFGLPTFADFVECFNITQGHSFVGLIKVSHSACVNTYEIIIQVNNQLFKIENTGVYLFRTQQNQWVPVTDVFGTQYLPTHNPCECTTTPISCD